MTACSGCGRCCDPVTLPFTQEEVQRMLPGEAERRWGMDARTREWVLHELTPISRREGIAARPDLVGRDTLTSTPDGWSAQPSKFYRCANYDPASRRCGRYDDRPAVCAGYPHYGQATLNPGIALPPECSFNADIGRPVAEWQPVRLGRAQ